MLKYAPPSDTLAIYYVTFVMGGIGLIVTLAALATLAKARRERAGLTKFEHMMHAYHYLSIGAPFFVLGLMASVILLSAEPSPTLIAAVIIIGVVANILLVWFAHRQHRATVRLIEHFRFESEAANLREEE